MTAHSSPWMTDELAMLQDSCRSFFTAEMAPHEERWQKQGHIDREFWNKAGEFGLLCASVPEEYGGMGGDFRHEAVITTEQFRAAGFSGFGNSVHSQICAGYILDYGTEDQKQRWLPKMASGEMVCAIAMTEPGTGSDLQNIKTNALRDGNDYVLNGSKTFITNGQQADLIIVVCKTDTTQGAKGISLLVVETEGAEGFARGRNLEKLGLKSQDTSELFFDEVRVPPENLLGGVEGQGFYQLMKALPQERLVIALGAAAVIEKALEDTIAYTSERRAFGQALIEMQNTRFKLAEAKTIAHIARVFLDDCVAKHLRGELDAATASMAKWWVTQMQCDVVDECLQLHGGYGYMLEYPIANMYADARVQKIYGGSNEIMKELIARTLTE
ncbi:acyl-CoA dehydrogenase family protein [Phaeobacter gallaeciensis]|uniref:acyl-CoA dehydrogenase family protein n=1 Tax=Phaeobacter gallaeciensis TaxID=60890 RepID=UPI00237EFCA9|nr:acyl-CoA dehydrogenase family protein [Phaeobacter gallaeciensis]MDE4303908.1 acyl-CoA dehydrogenase family protein [Phaeobacter gallaeciensis]MDE4308967.1 acyl-CoA dehydrogenase family protein [Phaeobacter gallaeciensis]MDE4313479.1 acyl-CoA dehydrogenase family protein [Phaeobacter gallaeciensis]MDE4317896.1 acyl-CoA dehydrogenase family protein [Phaeobacter gallaeciensis]MDE4322359.1 acyl-CoA dehydrogenase family protein [Phaeobacter gallaeciensis]